MSEMKLKMPKSWNMWLYLYVCMYTNAVANSMIVILTT